MPSKFDEYLNKGGFSQEDAKAAQVERAESVDRNSAPTPVTDQSNSRPDAPQPAISEERKAGIESTQQDAPNAHDQQSNPSQPINEESKAQADAALETPEDVSEEPKQGVEADYPSSAEKGEDTAETIGGGASDGVGSMEEEER